jgi:hypothetical protein
MMRRALLTVLFLTASRSGFAICLNGIPSVTQEYQHSPMVFVGTVTGERNVRESKSYLDGVMYTVIVDEVLRGSVPTRMRLFSENSSGRFLMHVGSTYLLFVYRAVGRTIVDACGNSGVLSERAAVLESVRRLKNESK